MPHSKEVLAYTELLEYPKRGSKIKALSGKKPSPPTSRRTSLAQTIGPAKRETTPPQPQSRIPDHPVASKPAGPPPRPPPPTSRGQKIVSLRPYVASFQGADKGGEEADTTPDLPPASALTVSMKPPPDDSHGFIRPFYMTVQGNLDEQQPAHERPKKAPVEPPRQLVERPPENPLVKRIEKLPEKPPVPETRTASGVRRRLPLKLRPFRGAVHDTNETTSRAKPLITEKKVAPPVARTAAGAPATRSFAMNVKSASGGLGPRRVSATRVRATSRGPAKTAPIHIHDSSINITRNLSDTSKLATPSKPFPPVPPGTRIISMSSGPENFRETMLWDFSPTPPMKVPQLHSKRVSITPTETPKIGTIVASKSLPKDTPEVTKPAGVKLYQAKGSTTTTTPTLSTVAPPVKTQAEPAKIGTKTTPAPEQGKAGKEQQKAADNKTAISAPSTARASKDTVAVPVRPPTRTEVSPKKDEKQASAPQRGKPSEEAVTEKVPSVTSAAKASKETTLPPAKRAGHAEANTAKAGRPTSTSSTRKDSKEAAAPVKTAVHATASTAKTEEPLSTSTVAQKTPSTSSAATKDALKPAVHVAPNSSTAEKAASEVHSAKSSAPAITGSVVPPSILKDASATVLKSQQQPEHSAAKDIDKPLFASSSAKHPQEAVPKPATTTATPDHTTAATGAITAASVVPAPAATTAATSEKSQLESSANMPLSEVVLAHAKVEPPKPATAATPAKAPLVKSILHKPPSQEIVPRRHSVVTIAPQTTPQEHDNAIRDAKIASNVKPSDRKRRPSSSQIAIRAVVRTTTQGESKALVPRPAATPAKRLSADAETGMKLEVKPAPETKAPLSAQPPIPCRPYKACIQGTGTNELPKEPQRRCIHFVFLIRRLLFRYT
ncbi:hypothetical protein HPB51_017448 [Rhipicephalus microplus]|uniref:Uncharacterized protein n=1 Tax=Rhipicephalus microplus TaxID=6941 RepID=A0A9J6E380_RHIMP|nr:hypothetical protein HPB51_017448 [Rhipicephalus microplus]